MKRIFIVLLSLVLFFSLIGCGGDAETEGTEENPTLVTFLVAAAASEKPVIEEVIADFEEANPTIDVELMYSVLDSEQRKQNITTALNGKQSDPDVFLMDIAWIGQLAASGWLADLEKHGVDASGFYDSIIELADRHKGKLIGVPAFVDGGLLYYRTDLLEKYGYSNPPETWSDLIEISKKVQEGERKEGNKDFWGFVWQGKQYEGLICDALEQFVSAGGGFLNKQGEPIIYSPENEKALQTMVDIIHKHKISPPNTYTGMAEEEARRMFQFGNAMFERNWPYAYGLHQTAKDSEVKGKVGVAPLPHYPGGQSASTLGGWHMGMSVYSDQKKAAGKFVSYYTSEEVQKHFVLKTGWYPGRPAIYDDAKVVDKYPHIKNLKKVFTGAVPRPTVPYYSEMSSSLQKYINSALAKAMPVEEALKKAQKDVSAIISKFE